MKLTNLYTILVPKEDNAGNTFMVHFHQEWDEKVCAIIGGLTLGASVMGRWYTNKSEKMLPVNIACTETELFDILEITKEHYKQHAVMAWKISDYAIIF